MNPGEAKSDEGRVIPLEQELYGLLVMQRHLRDQRSPGCPWVFFRFGKCIEDFLGAWNKACKRAGMWEGDEQTGKRTQIFHDLRRKGARNPVRAGVAEAVVMKIGGPKTRSVFDRYNIASGLDLHDGAAKLGNYLARVESARHKPTWY